MPARIAALGDNCIDRFLPPVNRLLAGGNAVNVAIQVARHGGIAGYFGAIGADAEGMVLRDALLRNGVDIEGLVIDPARRTAYTDIETLADGDRRIGLEDFGACADYRASDAAIEMLRRYRHVHIGWLSDGGAAKRRLRQLGASVSQDLSVNNSPENLAPEGLDIAFRSAEAAMGEASARALVRAGAGLAVVTLGAAGSLAFDGTGFVHAEALPVEPIDTTGAGDSFIAGFLLAWLAGASLAQSLAAGAVAARDTCLHPGGFPQPETGLDTVTKL